MEKNITLTCRALLNAVMLFANAGWEFLQALKLMIGLEQSALCT